MDRWTEEECLGVINAGGNTAINEVLERYCDQRLPKDQRPKGMQPWEKPLPDSSYQEKLAWIRCKYDDRIFSMPGPNERPDGNKGSGEISDSETKHTSYTNRLIDNFFVAGASSGSVLECVHTKAS